MPNKKTTTSPDILSQAPKASLNHAEMLYLQVIMDIKESVGELKGELRTQSNDFKTQICDLEKRLERSVGRIESAIEKQNDSLGKLKIWQIGVSVGAVVIATVVLFFYNLTKDFAEPLIKLLESVVQ